MARIPAMEVPKTSGMPTAMLLTVGPDFLGAGARKVRAVFAAFGGRGGER